jgi:hypothetical protein
LGPNPLEVNVRRGVEVASSTLDDDWLLSVEALAKFAVAVLCNVPGPLGTVRSNWVIVSVMDMGPSPLTRVAVPDTIKVAPPGAPGKLLVALRFEIVIGGFLTPRGWMPDPLPLRKAFKAAVLTVSESAVEPGLANGLLRSIGREFPAQLRVSVMLPAWASSAESPSRAVSPRTSLNTDTFRVARFIYPSPFVVGGCP